MVFEQHRKGVVRQAVRLQHPEHHQSWFKSRDRLPMEAVIEKCNRKGVDVYVFGSVVNNAVTGHPRDYNDIDIMLAGNPEAIKRINFNLGYQIPYGGFCTFNNPHQTPSHSFSVVGERLDLHHRYMSSIEDGATLSEFSLQPRREGLLSILLPKPSQMHMLLLLPNGIDYLERNLGLRVLE